LTDPWLNSEGKDRCDAKANKLITILLLIEPNSHFADKERYKELTTFDLDDQEMVIKLVDSVIVKKPRLA
jgi:hypothetical protein